MRFRDVDRPPMHLDHMLQARNIIGVQRAVNTRIFAQNEMAAAFRLSRRVATSPSNAPGHRLSPATMPARVAAPARPSRHLIRAASSAVSLRQAQDRPFFPREKGRMRVRDGRMALPNSWGDCFAPNPHPRPSRREGPLAAGLRRESGCGMRRARRLSLPPAGSAPSCTWRRAI